MLAVVLLLGTPAVGADVDLFAPAFSLARHQGTLQGEAATVREGVSVGVTGAWVADPVLRGERPAVARLVPVHLQGSVSAGPRLRIDASLPIYADTDVALAGFTGPAVGDATLGALWSIAGSDDGPIAIGLLPRLLVGTGTSAAQVSRGWGASGVLAVSGRAGPFGWVLDGGLTLADNAPLQGEASGVGLGARTVAGATLQLARPLRVGAEVDAWFGGVANNVRDEQRSASVQGFAQLGSEQGLGVLVGGGTGLIDGVGTPRFRVFASLSWTSWRSDLDGDTIADRIDGCPADPEDTDGFEDQDGCPEPNNDADGLVDAEDQCPDDPEDVDGWADDDGCPEPDNDEDGVLDGDDECPVEGGLSEHGGCPDRDGDGLRDLDDGCPDAAGAREDHGCPDSDGDGLHDGVDRCPDEARPEDETLATTDGCRHRVYVTDHAVVTDRIPFPEGRITLGASTRETLDAVAKKLLAHPELGRVEIQGHTDNVGPSSFNRRLSQRRANAVRDHLVERGVPVERLVARGYGEARPRFTNRTERGRTQNRRVQFVLLDPPGVDPTDGATAP